MKQIIAKAFAAPPEPKEREERETPIQQTLAAVQEITGGVSLPELLKPHARNEANNPISPWAPIIGTVGEVVNKFLQAWPGVLAQRTEQLRLEYQIRTLGVPGAPALPPAPPTRTVAAQPAAQTTPQNGGIPDAGQIMSMIVQTVCADFDKAPVGKWGENTAVALDFQLGELLEATPLPAVIGTGSFADFLGTPSAVRQFMSAHPDLAKRMADPRWKVFELEFLGYTVERWGEPESGDSDGQEERKGPQPAA